MAFSATAAMAAANPVTHAHAWTSSRYPPVSDIESSPTRLFRRVTRAPSLRAVTEAGCRTQYATSRSQIQVLLTWDAPSAEHALIPVAPEAARSHPAHRGVMSCARGADESYDRRCCAQQTRSAG